MKLKYPLIVTDFDGTLLRDDHTIAQETLDAIKRYQSLGGRFAICTGRTLSSILPIARGLGLKGLVACFQGSIVADIESGEIVEDGFIESSGAAKICRAMEEKNLHIHAYDTYEYYSNMDDELLKKYEQIVGVKAKVETNQPLSALIEGSQMKIRKVLALMPPEEKKSVYEYLSSKLGEEYYVTYSSVFLVEITNRNYSKATALERIAAYYDTTIEQTIAVGDSLNDLPMIERAGLGVAVKNADVLLHEKADLSLAYSNNENAIGHIIDEYALQK